MDLQFGWSPDPEGVARILEDPEAPVWELTEDLYRGLGPDEVESEGKTTILFDALKRVHPNWKRGAQGIGDCVSWGFELGTTLLMAIDAMLGKADWHGEAATESIYGGSRVEARGRTSGGWSDGSYGGAAAKWLTKWGVLLRQDYSSQTGNPDHNLTQYDAKRAKAWGNYGCGGQGDGGKLDAVARQFPVVEAHLCKSFKAAAAAIESGYPVAVCSGQGFTNTRDSQGFIRASGSWAHCMLFAGARWDRPGLLLSNSWGNNLGTKNPFFPDGYWPEVLKCSGWVDASTCDRMLEQEDSYILTGVKGLPRRKIDWSQGWEVLGA